MMTMVQALRAAAAQFRQYEKHHQDEADKIDPDKGSTVSVVGKLVDAKMAREAKAKTNRDLADMCERVVGAQPYQVRVLNWSIECFGLEATTDKTERADRLLEEVLELLQAAGYDFSRIPMLTEYVAGRPPGDIEQEVGGTTLTLFSFCNAHGIDVGQAAERELERVTAPDTLMKIRAKQASKPRGGPLPQ